MLRSLIRLNMRACARLAHFLPQAQVNFEELYLSSVAHYMNAKTGQTIVDVGGGRSCRFAKLRSASSGNLIVSVDISKEELAHNHDADETRVANIVESIGFPDDSVDLVVSRSVLEHIIDQERFIRTSWRTLKPGGVCIHFFPCKFAPFAVANQMLPICISRRVVQGIFEGKEGILGFPAKYDRTYHGAFVRLLIDCGFSVKRIDISYYQSGYFSFCIPLFIASAIYEMLVYAMGIKNLGAYMIVVAAKDNN
ncbi:MAG: class I SAM-dependent methyltransferase [Candidatus Hydrogenedentes bacterium]|nr:class I SAM-dependent methyltransferase [Candidatus Hydrogenedentota bacterium]